MIYASLRTYRDSVTELNTLFIIRSLSFFSPNPPIKWIQMNFSHKPNAVLLSLKDTKIYTCCVGIVLTDVMR